MNQLVTGHPPVPLCCYARASEPAGMQHPPFTPAHEAIIGPKHSNLTIGLEMDATAAPTTGSLQSGWYRRNQRCPFLSSQLPSQSNWGEFPKKKTTPWRVGCLRPTTGSDLLHPQKKKKKGSWEEKYCLSTHATTTTPPLGWLRLRLLLHRCRAHLADQDVLSILSALGKFFA